MEKLYESMYQLIVETSTKLPKDVRRAILKAKQRENAGTRAAMSLATITENIKMADENVSPICQDTGLPTFKIKVPVGINQIQIKETIKKAIAQATKDGKLRPNSVDSLTGENSGDNLGEGLPVVKFEQWEKDYMDVRLILKGGGCENKNIQYSLPCELEGLGRAGRDLDGIRKCILHAVYQAQGQGCSAGFIGVGIGGDRSAGYDLAKEQLFREVDDVNPNEELRQLEEYIMENANKLGIGTMGFGGETTLLGCKVGAMHRIPASFFVSVAYNCWAFRRLGVHIDPNTGEIIKWLYQDGEDVDFQENAAQEEHLASTDSERRVITLQAPITEEQIRELKVGDVVRINGIIYTGRDAIHKYLMDHDAPVDLNGQIIYHCGPVMLKDENGNWEVKAAGPTTSIREEPYQGDIMKKFGIRAVMGKGGMGQKTLQALKEHGGVYLNAIGGAAQYYADCIEAVEGVDLLEFGIPEAMWHLRVKDFTAVVTMDSHGNSLHEDIEKSSLEKLSQFKEPVFS
ncbi:MULTISPECIES: fumarate hydratase [Aeribacillus]|jgi:hydro-lyases, Fe-S type, tartrate/fumarate subfamily, alpha region/hydro-lyases, Fe-S type, tartrate/fumarate subfamily, beta region|uniref:Putative fumarate hydratase class I n=1 Tax=Geobacillus stearothermophilus TaxID=1422 RepID=FUMA_GEOSE|nr:MULTISPECIES: fumarate hydratase [Aeribacillus]Q04718.1 RecName: Full=Putative fumarate hydratase class I; Short=Fumarase [Geobacillus stearothermophilus]AAA72317.1 fumarase [Geobacillus stearothermophilus]KZM56678.1 fumarate hydratase [Aeribacillus pallidus]MED0651489.1 fumarate hydratase [Aeribacillus composti]MED0701541.1 fumarate hydratase [Aeribacillus composti]MED4488023.1 fumarate hydratase [Aeribacillus pallidus]